MHNASYGCFTLHNSIEMAFSWPVTFILSEIGSFGMTSNLVTRKVTKIIGLRNYWNVFLCKKVVNWESSVTRSWCNVQLSFDGWSHTGLLGMSKMCIWSLTCGQNSWTSNEGCWRISHVRSAINDNWMLHHDNAPCHTPLSINIFLEKKHSSSFLNKLFT